MAERSKFLEIIMNFMDITDKFNLNENLKKSVNEIWDIYGGFQDKNLDNETFEMYFKFLTNFRKEHEYLIYEVFSGDLFTSSVGNELDITQILYFMSGDLYAVQGTFKFVYKQNEWVRTENFNGFILNQFDKLISGRERFIKNYVNNCKSIKNSKNNCFEEFQHKFRQCDNESETEEEINEREKFELEQKEKQEKKFKRTLTELNKEVEGLKSCIKSYSRLKYINNFMCDNTFYSAKKCKFNNDPEYYNQLHFKNGYLDLLTRKFYKRTIEHLITEFLPYDYTEDYDKEKFNDISSFFKKIQPNKEQRRFTTRMLLYCLHGGNKEKIMLMNIGYSAANGKSTTLKIQEKVFPIYTTSLDQNTFSETCNKRHKYLSDLIRKPIRLAYIEELSKERLDVDFLKKFVDADTLDLEQLYTTEINQTKIQATLITTSNRDPNSDMDEGLSRRIVIQHYNSQFVRPELVNIEKNKYPIDLHYVDKFDEDEYKIAYLHYILNAGKLEIPNENRSITRELLEENDEFKCAFDRFFIITGNSKDKVYKHDVVDMLYGTKYNTVTKVSKELKRFNVKLNHGKHIDNKRGCFEGIQKIIEEEDEL